jgi:hypothetical protein
MTRLMSTSIGSYRATFDAFIPCPDELSNLDATGQIEVRVFVRRSSLLDTID